jgi:hypothetical protein
MNSRGLSKQFLVLDGGLLPSKEVISTCTLPEELDDTGILAHNETVESSNLRKSPRSAPNANIRLRHSPHLRSAKGHRENMLDEPNLQKRFKLSLYVC